MPTFTTTDGAALHYELRGDLTAPPVVLLHGLLDDSRQWGPVASRMDGDYLLVLPDLRGHGGSRLPVMGEPSGIERYALDVAELLDHLEIPLAALIGHDLGGIVALEMATRWSERGICLVLSGTWGSNSHASDSSRFVSWLGELDARAAAIEQLGARLVGARAARSIGDPFLAEGVRSRYARLDTDGHVAAIAALHGRRDHLAAAAELRMPVLLVAGEHDPARSALAVLASAIPGARTLTFPQAGHDLPVQQPQRLAEAILSFLRDVEDIMNTGLTPADEEDRQEAEEAEDSPQ